MQKMDNVCVVILGGGRGTRLFPLTKERSKPAVPFGAEFRLIDIPMSNCINSGLNHVYILTQFLMASLQRHVYQTFKFDAFSSGFVEVLSAEQTPESTSWYQGTADAVRKQRHHFINRKFDYILILSGDHLYQMNYQAFINHHITKKADVTIGAYPVSEEKVSELGVLQADENQKVTNFFEKPKEKTVIDKLRIEDLVEGQPERQFMASMGIYVFSRNALKALLEDSIEDDFGHGIIPASLHKFRVYSYVFQGYWEDIGTLRSFYEANLALTEMVPQFNLYDPDHKLYSRPRFLAPTKISRGARIEGSIIGNGSLLQRCNIINSVIGVRSIIHDDVTIENSVMMGADFYTFSSDEKFYLPSTDVPVGVGDGTFIKNTIIDKNARIGKNCVIENKAGVEEGDRNNVYIREGLIIIAKDTIIPDNTVI